MKKVITAVILIVVFSAFIRDEQEGSQHLTLNPVPNSITAAGTIASDLQRNENVRVTKLKAASADVYQRVPNASFSRGEEIHFKMTYGIFNVGRGSAKIHPDYFKVNGRDCFKVDVAGKTVGMVDWVTDINDQWGAYIDTVAIVPHQFYRKIREGRYKKDEWTTFDHEKKTIEVKPLDKKGNMKDPKYYPAPPLVRDMIGGFLYLRVMDFSKLYKGDTILVTGFFEDEFYKLKIVYKGRDTIKLKVGKVRALKFMPVMPDNKLFDGENSITAWFSDDRNRIPLKIEAEMFVGSTGVELTSYKNLRNPLNIVK